jgi:hypothetical protein
MTLDTNVDGRIDTGELDDELRRWLDEEGFSSKRVTEDDDAEFHYVIQYPAATGDANIHIVRPPNRAVLALLLGVQLSPNHRQPFQQLDDPEKTALVHRIRRVAFEGGEVGFAPQMEGDILARWQLDVSIYDDGLTQHHFFTSLRRLYTKHLELIEVLNEAFGTEESIDVQQQDPSTSGGGMRGYI